MRFYNLNIRHHVDPHDKGSKRESHAERWIAGRQRAPIFYGKSTIVDLLQGRVELKGRARNEAINFCRLGSDPTVWECTRIVTIDEGFVWIFKPSGTIEVDKDEDYPDDLPKSFPIANLGRFSIKDVPVILASMKSSPNFSQSTFQEIPYAPDGKYAGNIIAICQKLGIPAEAGFTVRDRIDCLSSIEFETLIAKLLEESGLFVPAYKGGFMKGIDLIVSNDEKLDIAIDGLVVPSGTENTKSIQVKLRADDHASARGVADYLVTSEATAAKNCFGREWIRGMLKKCNNTRAWLHRATRWAEPYLMP